MESFDSKQTIRQQLVELLETGSYCLRDLSQALSIPEKEVIGHLSHIERTVRSRGKKFEEIPHVCLSCGFVFDKRKRFTKPGRCPKCKNSHIQSAFYHIKR